MKFTSLIVLAAATTAWATNHEALLKNIHHGAAAVIAETSLLVHTPTLVENIEHLVTETAMEHIVTETAPALIITETAPAHAVVSDIAAQAVTHTVTVGGNGLAFNPTEVTAAVGDVIQFIMLAKNHTVTQSTFDAPCVRKADGIDSGFLPNDANDTATAPTFEITVDTEEATWWYCRQRQPAPHCGSGMVFAVNPTPENNFEIFRNLAIAQNGTAAVTGTAAATLAPTATAPVTLTVDNEGLPPATTTLADVIASPPAQTAIAPGWNNQGVPGACNCACFCGVSQFPAGAGVGSFGGLSGSLPAPWGSS